MSLWDRLKKPKLLFSVEKPSDDYEKFVGRTCMIPNYETGKKIRVEIKRIVGNVFKPAFYEVTDPKGETHLIGMLRFHAQMNGDTSITEKQFRDFEETKFHVEPKAGMNQTKSGLIV